MRTIEITQRCTEELLLSILKEDLKNVEEDLYNLQWNTNGNNLGSMIKKTNKNVKTLKRAINFYSVEPPYADI